ncbi:MAG: alpha/beta fold hydrolase [Thiolinea sp.]
MAFKADSTVLHHTVYSTFRHLCVLLLSLWLLAACGDGDGSDTTVNNPAEDTGQTEQRGRLKSAQKLMTHSRNELDFANGAFSQSQQQQLFQYDVDLYKLVYTTLDADEQLIDASGLLALPQRNPQLPAPLLSFQHGSLYYDAEAPSNDLSNSAPPLLFATLGYITLAPDYVGYGTSLGAPHPYLLKTPSAAAVIDLLTAAQTWLANQHIALNGQLFLTGYSQGGYVTMAAHQALQAMNNAELQVSAAVPAAGPYDVGASLDAFINERGFRQADSGEAAQRSIAELIPGHITPDDSDIIFDNRIFSAYISDGTRGVAAHNVYDWKALAPVRLFHGRDDETVPFINATRARDAMQARGSNDVQLIECNTEPAGHSECVVPYGLYVIDYLSGIAQGL